MKHLSFTLRASLFLSASLLTAFAEAAAPAVKHHGRVADGTQFDVVTSPNDNIHLIARQYYQFSTTGELIANDAQIGDEEQSPLSFPPALAADPENDIHVLTRSGGSWGEGVDVHYRIRSADGTWSTAPNYNIGIRETRNYVIGIAAPTTDDIYAFTSIGGENVWGDLRLWNLTPSLASHQGNFTNIWRLDADARLRSANNKLYLATSKPDGGGVVYYSWADMDGNVFSQLEDNLQSHREGSGRSGSPDIYPDERGNIHLTYGSRQTVYYNRYKLDNSKAFSKDKLVLSNLNPWHLSFGLSTVAASDNGKKVIVAALRTDGTKLANNSTIVLSYSIDSGESWDSLEIPNLKTSGGEGRLRPRMVAIGEKFYLFYSDNDRGGISLVSIDMAGVTNNNAIVAPISVLLLD